MALFTTNSQVLFRVNNYQLFIRYKHFTVCERVYISSLKSHFKTNLLEKHFLQTGSTVEDMKKHLAVKFDTEVGYIDIVCLEEGTIHTDSTPLVELPRPLQVMIGNPDRKAFTTTLIKNSRHKHLITMSCGHSISKI